MTPRPATAARPLVLLVLGFLALGVAWSGPLPAWARDAFSAHMALHMIVVAVAAPLLAWGVTSTRWDPVALAPRLFAPVPASIAELVVVWGWHAPALHVAARQDFAVFLAEQASFFAAGLFLWLAACGPRQPANSARALAGVGALVFTSMHMTLLGALFALGWRPLYSHAGGGGQHWLPPVADQQVGGVIMLLIGGGSYLTGGLLLIREVLAGGRRMAPTAERREARHAN